MTACLASAPSTALDGAIDLEADQAVMEIKERTATYRGNIVITQGGKRLTGDVLTIHYSEDNKIERARLLGDPAIYEERSSGENPDQGKADQIEYDAEAGVISLQGNAFLRFNAASVSGSVITYDLRLGTINVDSDNDDRVRIHFPAE